VIGPTTALDEATTPREALREAIALQASIKPDLHGVATAARLMWATTSQRVWEDLVIDQGWTTDQYRTHLTDLLESALLKMA